MNLLISKLNRWKVLIFLNAIYAIAGILWILLIPYNNAPDENTHFHYSVEFILQNHRLPVWGVDDLERFQHALSSYNQMPALNYVVYAIGAVAGNKLFGLESYLGARLVSLLWGILFLNFLFLAIKEACGNEKNALIATAAFALIPQVLFSFCYVNADSHSLAIAAILGYALMRFFRTQFRLDHQRRQMKTVAGRGEAGLLAEAATAQEGPGSTTPVTILSAENTSILFAGAAIGLLFSAKYNYFIYLPFIGIFLVLAVFQGTISRKTAIKFFIASALLSLLISGFWFIRNWFIYGNPLPLLLSEDFFRNISLARDIHPVNRGLNIPALAWLVQNGFIGTTFNSFFAVFGYLNVGFYREIYFALKLVVPLLAAFFILGLAATRDRLALIALAWLALFIGAVMAMHVWTCLTFDFQPQGRYQFAILVPLALYSGWVITRHVCLKKYILLFLIGMAGLFIGANLLIIRTYGPPIQFSVSRPGPDKSFGPLKCSRQKAKRTEKNFYATENIPLDNELACLRIELPKKFMARYRDFKVELETGHGPETVDWTTTPPENMVNVKFDKKLNAFETCGHDACFILPLPTKTKSVKIAFRLEHRRLYDLE